MSREPSLQDPLRFNRKTSPCAVVIFGANGDLTKRKLMPALYRLAFEGRLAPGFAVVGISRTAMSDDDFRGKNENSGCRDDHCLRISQYGLGSAISSAATPA